MSAAKAKSAEREAVTDAITGDSVTLISTATRNGKTIREPVTFEIPAVADLPRTIRRKIRQVQVKYASPAKDDRSGGRFDMFGLAFEIGEMIARHHGVTLNLDDDSVPAAEADATDAVITALGMRVLSSQMNDEDGDAKNVDDAVEVQPAD